jgi:hypothetical protein
MSKTATYALIASTTTTNGQTSLSFSSIPSTYTDLVVVANCRNNSGTYDLQLRVNSDGGSNYSRTYLVGDGTTAASARASSVTYAQIGGYIGTSQGVAVINFMDYANTTTNKTFLSRAGSAAVNTGALVALWRSTAAINSITFDWAAGAFAADGSFRLYGIQAGNA